MTWQAVMPKDQVFVLRCNGQEVWKVCYHGEVLPVEWNSQGAAQAFLSSQKRSS